MNPVETTPTAVIGVGRMGRHHARVYAELAEAQLVAVVDTDANRAETVASEYGCAACTSVDQLLDRHPEVRAVTVATPTQFHDSAAEVLVPAGVACLIEKPLAGSAEQAHRIAELAEQHSVTVQVGHTERFNPVVRAVAELDLQPRFIQVDRVSPMSFRSTDVGVVFDVMIHDLDIALMLAKTALVDVRAVGVAVISEHEDLANARLHFEDGCVANLTASRLALRTDRKLRVFTDTAYLSLDYAKKTGYLIRRGDNDAALEQLRDKIAAGEDLTGLDYTQLVNVERLAIDDEEPLRAEIAHFLDAVYHGTKSGVDAVAGCAAVEAAERVVEAIHEHQWSGLDRPRME